MKNLAKIINKEKGVVLIITVTMISIIMLIATLIVNIVVVQLRLASDIADSVVAIYAADSGVEYKLYQIRKDMEGEEFLELDNGATASITVLGVLPNLTIRSLGSYRLVKRQFEVNF